MSVLTVRNVSPEVHRALRLRAAENGRSTEAEVRAILEAAVRPSSDVGLGTYLHQAAREAGLTDEDVDLIESVRDRAPLPPLSFE